MNVLQVNKFFYKRGGAEHHMFDLAELLTKHGDNVLYFSMQDKHNEKSEFSKYFVSNADFSSDTKINFWQKIKNVGRMFYSFEAKKKIGELLKNEKIDLVHLHNIYHHISPSILPVIKKQGIPVVMTLHDYKLLCPNYTFYHHGAVHEEDGRGWYCSCVKNKCLNNSFVQSFIVTMEMIFHNKLKKYYEKNVDLFIAPSQFVKDIFVRFGWDEKKIVVLEHFLPLNFKIKDRVSDLPKEKRFICVGRLSSEKGIDKLIKYWLKNNIKYKLDIFGNGPLMPTLQELVSGCENIILHGQKDRNEIYKNIVDYTAMIVPTEFYEPFGLIVLEAFASGLPVITSGRGALGGLIKKSKAGLIFSWDNNSLQEKLEQINDSHRASTFGDKKYRENALQYIRENHQAEGYYNEIMRIYKSV
ncbi:glycosyltransferase [Patescibacteria group bacterium]|nr:glycosyltransferase [Patescibacteria group bacterium]